MCSNLPQNTVVLKYFVIVPDFVCQELREDSSGCFLFLSCMLGYTGAVGDWRIFKKEKTLDRYLLNIHLSEE